MDDGENPRYHDDVIKWKHFPRYWPFVRGIHRSPVNSPHKGQWRGGLMFSSIYAWINRWANNGNTGDLRRHSAHYDVIVMIKPPVNSSNIQASQIIQLCRLILYGLALAELWQYFCSQVFSGSKNASILDCMPHIYRAVMTAVTACSQLP